jgi:mercuric ion binding protein
MKRFALGLFALVALAASAYAADIKVTGIHNCCPMCANGIKSALAAGGATNVNLAEKELSFSAEDPDKALKALFDAGYAGRVEGARPPRTGVRRDDPPVKSVKLTGVHNCCGGCTKAIQDAVKPFGTCSLKAKETSFTVTSDNDINVAMLIRALRQAGYNARVEK